MFVIAFVYIEKYKLQTEKRKLNYRDYFLHFVILLILKVYIFLVMQKLKILVKKESCNGFANGRENLTSKWIWQKSKIFC